MPLEIGQEVTVIVRETTGHYTRESGIETQWNNHFNYEYDHGEHTWRVEQINGEQVTVELWNTYEECGRLDENGQEVIATVPRWSVDPN